MSETSIQVRLPLKEVKKRLASLPGILTGKLPDPFRLRILFFSVIAKSLFTSIREAFLAKSLGSTDDLGASWRALKPVTKKRRVAPSLLSRFPLSAQLYILRVSDTLLESLSPGNLAGSQYKPKPNQIFNIVRDTLEIGTSVPYAGYVHKKRKLWPSRIQAWVNTAISNALDVVCEAQIIHMSRER